MNTWAWVGLGSALGGCLRYLVSLVFSHNEALAFPWDTLVVNTTGSALIGALAAASAPRGNFWSAHWRPFMMTGFCGGYTTFSVFSLQTLYLFSNDPQLALLNLGVTAAGCILAVWIGFFCVTRMRQN